MLGYAFGQTPGNHAAASMETILLQTPTPVLISDPDRRRFGTIIASQQPLLDLQQQLSGAS
jgi:hypothetical protein